MKTMSDIVVDRLHEVTKLIRDGGENLHELRIERCVLVSLIEERMKQVREQ